jgi:hypothetical protein
MKIIFLVEPPGVHLPIILLLMFMNNYLKDKSRR